MAGNTTKKLQKLPHVFGKVLELPFRSDVDVEVQESAGFLRFVTGICLHSAIKVKTQAVEIHPGVTKIVVRNGAEHYEDELLLEQLKVDTWRFRLPASARPELATAMLVNGELIVTVPKSVNGRGVCDGRGVSDRVSNGRQPCSCAVVRIKRYNNDNRKNLYDCN